MDEPNLIQAARRGDVEAFNALVMAYQSGVYNLAYRLLGETAAAADATQDAFIAAYNSLKQYRGGSFKAWLMRIVTNACYDEQRRRMRRRESSLEAMTDDGETAPRLVSRAEDPEQLAQQHALSRAIQDCLQALSDEHRLVAILADVQGYDYGEISHIAGVPLGTIKSRLSRARQSLRHCLQGAAELLPIEYRLDRQASSAPTESGNAE
jgi:RNA polymerase sigma-70 factor (ECF subfamily)